MEFYRHRSYRPFWKWDTPCLFGETRHLLCVWISALPGNINLSMQPRTCGESFTSEWPVSFVYDTTPHMREIRGVLQTIRKSLRYNPAHAGNPTWASSLRSMVPIQPRTCGESLCMLFYAFSIAIQPRTCRESTYTTTMEELSCDTTPHMREIHNFRFVVLCL